MLPRQSGRKRWNLHDGPRGSLRRLRCQMAEDGCAESQVVLAKHLLEEECELEADRVSNFKQALDWLICATEQGHQEARRLLRRCVRSGVVNENSAAIVRAKSCLAASQQETVARKAARDLFASLANGEEYITTAQLERRIREICSVTLSRQVEREAEGLDEGGEEQSPEEAPAEGNALLDACDQLANNGTVRRAHHTDQEYEGVIHPNQDIQNLTVDNLVSAAVHYCHGQLPLVSYDLTLTDPGLKALDHIPLLQQAFLHPIVFIKVLYLKLLYYLGTFSFRLSNVELMLFLVVYCFLGTDNLSLFVPLALYYFSFGSMVICTFKMLHAKKQFVDFRKWSGLFLRYSDGNLQPDESENLFVKNNLGPFIQFFLALLVNLFLYPFIATQWIPFSEFSVLSFFLMFLTLISFGSNDGVLPDLLALLSFSINVLAKYPYEKDTVVNQGWRFLDLHIQGYPSYIVGNGIEFCLNARVFFSLLIPVILAFMARRSGWQGVYKCAIPHCVTLSWLQIFIMSSQGATMYGLIRGTLALVCMFLFLPLVGIVTLLLPIFAFLQGITLSNILYTVAIVVCFSLSLFVTCMLAKMESTKKYITPFQLTLASIALIYLGTQFMDHINEDISPGVHHLDDKKPGLSSYLKSDFDSDYAETTYHITWEDYYSQCHLPSWAETNIAATQIKCSVLNGANVDWQGYVTEVKLDGVENKWSDFAELLPEFLKELFRCRYGEEYAACQGDGLYALRECDFVQNVAKQTGKGCHLNNLNRYSYLVRVQIDTGGGLLKKHTEITVAFDHHFTNFTRILRAQDRIRFRGVLLDAERPFSLGGSEPSVKAYEMSCLHCDHSAINGLTVSAKTPSLSKFASLFNTIANDMTVSAKYILNFVLNPIVVFK